MKACSSSLNAARTLADETNLLRSISDLRWPLAYLQHRNCISSCETLPCCLNHCTTAFEPTIAGLDAAEIPDVVKFVLTETHFASICCKLVVDGF